MHARISAGSNSILIFIIVTAVLAVVIVTFLRFYPSIYYNIAYHFSDHKLEQTARFYDDVAYCNTANPAQQLDLYLPKKQPFGPPPLVLYIHGGGWSEGDKNNAISKLYTPEFLARGLAFATIDYRLTHEARYPAQNNDVHCAVQYVMRSAHNYGYNPDKIAIMGDSAGGHLAAMEALRQGNKPDYKAIVMLYGVSDLWNQIKNHHDKNAARYLGGKIKAIANKDSPLYANLDNAPPFLIIHGTDDTIVPVSESATFRDKLLKHGVQTTYLPVNGASHAFVDTKDYHEKFVRNYIMQFLAWELYL